MSNSQNIPQNKKKYSGGLFIENDEFDCFVGNYADVKNDNQAQNNDNQIVGSSSQNQVNLIPEEEETNQE